MTSLIIGGEKPDNIRDFISIFAEALLTFWFQRFDISQDYIFTATAEVLDAVDQFLPQDVAVMPPYNDDPVVMAMALSESQIARELFIPEGPRTVESLVAGTIGLVEKLSAVQFTLTAIMGDIQE